MTTRALLKTEIDALPDEYLEVLHKIIRALAEPLEDVASVAETRQAAQMTEWQAFVQTTFGCLAATPLERGPQGTYEVREAMQ
ncbi:MAG: hypothetical protein JW934_12585 [Anaerolineae bacterium]|nr:hypothetical protein [Anaerolineae bacterium]